MPETDLPVEDYSHGFPSLAAFQSSSVNFNHHRSFAILRTRLLLERDIRLAAYEEEFKAIDERIAEKDDLALSTTKKEFDFDEWHHQRRSSWQN